jgi:hypothetical protein
MVKFALPGLMPQESPKEDAHIVAAWSEPLNLEFYRQPVADAEILVTWLLVYQGGFYLLKMATDFAIAKTVDGTERVYTIKLAAECLPAGTHRIEIQLEDIAFLKLYVTVPDSLTNELTITERPLPVSAV